MLGKLIKHDFKASGRMMGLMTLCALLISGVTGIAFALDIPWFQVTTTLLLLVAMVAVVIFTYVVVAVRFFKSMYGREGYLTMTLPASSSQLLGAKVMVSMTWLLLSVALCAGMLSLLMGLLYAGDGSAFLQSILDIFDGWGAIAQLIAFVVCSTLIKMALFLSQMFFAVTLANTAAFQRYSIVSAVFLYLGITTVMSTVEVVLTLVIPLGLRISPEGLHLVTENMMGMLQTSASSLTSTTVGLGGMIFQLVEIAGLFFGTSQLIKRRLCIR